MKFLITGGCGFLGTNLASHLIENGEEVIILDNFFRVGSRDNLNWLKSIGKFSFHEMDTRDAQAISKLVADCKPDCVFHLAGQVAMTTSIANPRLDFEINVQGGINVLEAVRQHAPEAAVFFSSTNKVYGDLKFARLEERETRYVAPDYPQGFDENVPLDFQSPYGCSKGAIDQYMLDYQRIFGLRTVVFRHSSIFGGRQFPTYDQAWIGWFITQALAQRANPKSEAFTISGNGKQVRDVLFADDIVSCYMAALKNINTCQGQVFNIGGGMKNSLSLLELFDVLQSELDLELRYRQIEWRPSDQRIFVADIAKANKTFGWKPELDYKTGIRRSAEWLKQVKPT